MARGNAEAAFLEAQQFLEVTRAKVREEAAEGQAGGQARSGWLMSDGGGWVVMLQNSGTSEGSLWWMDRELEEAKKFMPRAKAAKLATTNNNMALSGSLAAH